MLLTTLYVSFYVRQMVESRCDSWETPSTNYISRTSCGRHDETKLQRNKLFFTQSSFILRHQWTSLNTTPSRPSSLCWSPTAERKTTVECTLALRDESIPSRYDHTPGSSDSLQPDVPNNLSSRKSKIASRNQLSQSTSTLEYRHAKHDWNCRRGHINEKRRLPHPHSFSTMKDWIASTMKCRVCGSGVKATYISKTTVGIASQLHFQLWLKNANHENKRWI
jgi:hypothetical protein